MGRGMVAEKKTVCRVLGRGLEDQFDVVAEAHVEHHVHFVEDDHFDRVELERAAAHVVHDAARRADDDVRALAQAEKLAVVGLAAVNRQGVEAAFEEGQLVDFLRNLHRQLARRAKDQNLRVAPRDIHLFNGGGGEGGGFAGAGLGLADHVLARHQQRNGFGLNGSGLLEAELMNGFEQFLRQTQFSE